MARDWLKQYQWKPGQSGNPGGSSKKRSIRKHLLELADLQDKQGRTPDLVAAAHAWNLAVKGDLDAIKWVAEQLDGKLPQAITSDGHLTIEVKRADRHH